MTGNGKNKTLWSVVWSGLLLTSSQYIMCVDVIMHLCSTSVQGCAHTGSWCCCRWNNINQIFHSPPIDPATHSISATTPVLFRGIFWWVTSSNVSHWSKGVMHVVIFTINNDVALYSFSQCTSSDWLVNSGLFTAFSHELSQIVLRHYTRNAINIVVCAITNNWMTNNAWNLHIWYNFLIVQWNRTELKKTCRVIMWLVAEILVV